MVPQAGVEYYTNHLGYRLECRLDLPDGVEPNQKVPILAAAPGFGGSRKSPYVLATGREALRNGIGYFSMNLTKVTERDNEIISVDTSKLTPTYALKTMECAFKHLMKNEHVDPDRIALTGFSFGAYASALYAAHANGLQKRFLPEMPFKPSALILNVLVPEPLRPFQKLINTMGFAWKWMGQYPCTIAGSLQDVSYGLYEDCSKLCLFEDVAPHITAPVLIIHGENDPYVTCDQVTKFKANLVQSAYVDSVLFKGVGHSLEFTKTMKLIRSCSTSALRACLLDKDNPKDSRARVIDKFVAYYQEKGTTELPNALKASKKFLLEHAFPQSTDAVIVEMTEQNNQQHPKLQQIA